MTIEFGLIEEAGRDEGSSRWHPVVDRQRSPLPQSPDVKRVPFVTETVIETDYDPSKMQDHLFIAPSLPFLRRELESLVRRFGIPVL